jgi:hypothetical protein
MGNNFFSLKRTLEFEPSSLDSETISVSNDPFTSANLPKEIMTKIVESMDITMIRRLMITCKSLRNYLHPWFFQTLTSEKYPDRATSGFIVDAIGNNIDTCLWRDVKFSLEGHDIPKGLSIHLFVNKTAKKISSHEVRSMIIQVSWMPPPNLRLFLGPLFSEVSFTSLKCLMLRGIKLSREFSQPIGALNLEVFHMANFSWDEGEIFVSDSSVNKRRGFDDVTSVRGEFFRHCKTLKSLYVVHPDESRPLVPPSQLKKLVIYCPESFDMIYHPESSESAINRKGYDSTGLIVGLDECHALEET